MLIHCTPQVLGFPVDLKKHFIQVPCVARPSAATAQLVRVLLPKFATPLAYRFVGDDNAALRQHLLNVAVAEAKAEGAPDCMADDLDRETEARVCVHLLSIA